MERTEQEKYDLLVTAIKANSVCKGQRQKFSVLRASPLGKYVYPEVAKDAAIDLIDCFHFIHTSAEQVSNRKESVQCLKDKGQCVEQINRYVAFQTSI